MNSQVTDKPNGYSLYIHITVLAPGRERYTFENINYNVDTEIQRPGTKSRDAKSG